MAASGKTDKKAQPRTRRTALAPSKSRDAGLKQQLAEARAQKAAAAEILKLISRSRTDAGPVFDGITRSAAKLCGAPIAAVIRFDGAMLHVASIKVPPRAFRPFAKFWPMPIGRAGIQGVVIRKRVLANVKDVESDPRVVKWAIPLYRKLKIRSGLWVPMLREGAAIGLIIAFHHEAEAFGPASEELLKTFADQAVIAIENVRSFNEARESLERQTATAEILKVIASSPSDVQPVFDAIAQNALRVFGGRASAVTRVVGGTVQLVSFTATSKAGNEYLKSLFPQPLSSSASFHSKAARTGKPAYVSDYETDPEVTLERKKLARVRGFRSQLVVPMLREGVAIGTVSVARPEAGLFTNHQINLLETFADQAVIAIENVRLFNETKESLERQTATGEILKVIASSPANVQPVFDAIVRSAVELFKVRRAVLMLVVGDQIHLGARAGKDIVGIGAHSRVYPIPLNRESSAGRAILDCKTTQIADIEAPGIPAGLRNRARILKFRSNTFVPLVCKGVAIGAIAVPRTEPGVLSDKQVDLLQTFADQAVIAIENVRLFNETAKALERQTATAEILRVISSSPTNIQPVLDAVAERGARLCEASDAFIQLRQGDSLRHAAQYGKMPAKTQGGGTVRIERGLVAGRAVLEGRQLHIRDLVAEKKEYPVGSAIAKEMGYRTILVTPLMREDVAIGTIIIRRTEVRPFTEKQMELIKTFADQAVIAIENVRLFNETRESLERQTATAEILKVIASSPADAQPVFDAIAASAMRLFGARTASVTRVARDLIHLAAFTHTDKASQELLKQLFPHSLSSPTSHGRAVRSCKPVFVADIESDPGISRERRQAARARGFRSQLTVPMLREGVAIGTIGVTRVEPGPFSDHQVSLVETFADQAVIAIENVRLFTETREALERQTATAEILRVISRSQTETKSVFEAIADSTMRLFGAWSTAVFSFDGELLHLEAARGALPDSEQILRQQYPRRPEVNSWLLDRCVLENVEFQIADSWSDPRPGASDLARARGYRSLLVVPMLRNGESIGAIAVSRQEAGGFAVPEAELLKTFADQAVIAIENVRLFNETEEALERQTATAEILSVIASSPSDVQPVFDAIAGSALRLFGGLGAAVTRVVGDKIHLASLTTVSDSGDKALRDSFPAPLSRGGSGNAIRDRKLFVVSDTETDPLYAEMRDAARARGYRSVMFVPLLRDGAAIGTVSITRREPGPFSEHQIGLLKTFADQAVIAIENVRLFTETREALERQTATAEILKVIASSPSDVQPVFNTILRSAVILCGAEIAAVFPYDGKLVHLGATHNWSEAARKYFSSIYPAPPSPELMSGRTILGKSIVKLADAAADAHYDPTSVVTGEWRRMLGIPIMREGDALGALVVCWREPGETPQRQVDLLQTFADQAVIAIQNVRLFTETKEALERQTATAEILGVISSSPTNIQPVLDTVAASAALLCEATDAVIQLREGDVLRSAAHYGSIPYLPVGEVRRITRGRMTGQAVLDGKQIHVHDLQEKSGEYPEGSALAREMDTRTSLATPLMREGTAIGTIFIRRKEVRPFSDRQLALVRTFADQAVIAIENVRLFNETKEALERQTATAEILKVISQSTMDVQPVLEAIVRSAAKLFPACNAFVFMRDGGLVRLRAMEGVTVDKRLREDLIRFYPVPFDPAVSTSARAMAERRPNACADTEAPEVPEHIREASRAARFRSNTVVPLVRDDEGIGSIVLTDPRPGHVLDEKQLALLQTFADQAVIAIENVRLFNETKEALERQTATAEILKVIASSPSDVQPVFDAIAKSSNRLLEGFSTAVMRVFDDVLHLVGFTTTSEAGDAALTSRFPMPLGDSPAVVGVVRDKAPVRIVDTEVVETVLRDLARARGFRSMLLVPLMREGLVIGVISVTRREPGEFGNHEVELLKTFADQAVIAIENVRLFNETKEALERQTATAEILRVISSSPTDIRPVFDVILENATRLCEAHLGLLGLYDGEKYETVAHRGASPEFAEWVIGRGRFKPSGGAGLEGMLAEQKPIHFADYKETPAYRNRTPMTVKMVELGGVRTYLAVPMLREGRVVGGITIYRPEVRPFTQKQIDLVSTFASQAVIAIENVRLFKELQSRTDALTKSVGQLTALGEVGQAISSTLDLETVLKTIVSRAIQLTGLDAGVIYEYDERGDQFELRTSENFDDESVAGLRGAAIRKGEGAIGTSVVTREPTQVPDTHAPDYPVRLRELLDPAGYRAVLAVPLLRENRVIGALSVTRKTPGPFAPEIVELLKTFATQSAMAIQNARLFREIAEKGKQLEVASQHKSNFLASMSHELRTPLNAILGFNEMIIGQVYGEVPADMQEPLNDIQTSGKHLLRLINNVLDLAKIEAGRMELSLQDYSVHDTVASVHSTLRPLAAEKGLEFLASVPNDVPLAYGDGGRMTQCLMNLAGNSLKFTKAGKVEISVETKDELLVYKVTDTGIGIPPDKIGSLFTEFKQTDATIASEYGGTGLGLSISRKFVEMHGGRIWVESELGKGSAFIIEVPLRVKTP